MTLSTAVLSIVRLSKPEFRSKEDKLAFAVHAYVISQGYKLVATGRAAESGTDFDADGEEVSISGWNELSGIYAFRYQDTTRGKRAPVFMKCIAAGPQLLIQWALGTASDASNASVLELSIEHFTTNESSSPLAYKNSEDLMSVLEGSLGLSLQSAGRGEAVLASGRAVDLEEPQRSQREREEEVEEQPYFPYGGQGLPAVPPTGVGFEDVVPPGVRAPGLRPPSPGGLMEGTPRRGGGMLVGPDHPIFGPGKLGEGVGVGREGPGPALPLGARWDPIGPPGTRGFRPDDFQKHDPSKPHPDMMQPGSDRGTDWDSFYG